jgi:hypothetical protein
LSPQIIGSILIGADDLVANLVASRIPHMANRTFSPCTALGVVRGGELVGGAVYHGYLVHDVQVSFALDRVAFIPWRALFSYPFLELGCARITAVVGRKNKKSRKLVEALGFKLEGVHLKGLDGHEDAFSFGMLRENCRWIKRETHGQIGSRRASAA